MYKQDHTNKSRNPKYDERVYDKAFTSLRQRDGIAAAEIRGNLLDILHKNPNGTQVSRALMRALDDTGHDFFVSLSSQDRE